MNINIYEGKTYRITRRNDRGSIQFIRNCSNVFWLGLLVNQLEESDPFLDFTCKG